MQERAGLLFVSIRTKRIFLILEKDKWSVPTFLRKASLYEDAHFLSERYSKGKIIPIELYVSKDGEFQYGTYVCLVESEFFSSPDESIAWVRLDSLPKNLHMGLKTTLNNTVIKTKIETILELNDA